MNYFWLIIFCIYGIPSIAQPFRYIRTNEEDRDSIKTHHIKSYKEWVASPEDTTYRVLSCIVEYDENGNLIRLCRINETNGTQNQWTYKYDDQNRLLEETTFAPDSMTILQQNIYKYDQRGNRIEFRQQYYKDGIYAGENYEIKKFDDHNNCIEAKRYGPNNRLTDHYQYIYSYNTPGRTKIKRYNADGELIDEYFETHHDYETYHEMGIDPVEEDDVMKHWLDSMQTEIITYHPTEQTYHHENGYAVWIFNSKHELLFWYEKNYLYHWFTYQYYPY